MFRAGWHTFLEIQIRSYPDHPRANWLDPRLRKISKCWKQPEFCLLGHFGACSAHFQEKGMKQHLFLMKFATTFLKKVLTCKHFMKHFLKA